MRCTPLVIAVLAACSSSDSNTGTTQPPPPDNNPLPSVTTAIPATVLAGGPAFTLTVNGTNFIASSVIRWNGQARPTTFVSSTVETAQIPATDIATAGTAQLTVFTPTPGGGTSAAIGDVIVTANGNVVYDKTNNISWLADFDLPASNRFGLPLCDGAVNTKTCVNSSGSMSYQAAAAWVAAMNAADYLGHSTWQIPTSPIRDSTCGFIGPQDNSFGWGCSASAFGSLYNALGLSAPATAVPVPNMAVGPFSNFQPALYWSGTSLLQPTGDTACCGTFSFNSGWQGSNIASNFLFLIPMIPSKIPETPASSGTGLQVNPGGQTVYDPIAKVTWLADANLPASNTFGMSRCTTPSPQKCVSQDGALNFNSAAQFITNMNAAAYLGQSNWQMPPTDGNCAAGYLCSVTTAPFQSLFYNQLGLTPGKPVVTAPNIAVGAFTNIRPYLYWTCQGTTIHDPCDGAPATGFQWSFWFDNGFQGTDVLAHDMYVTAYFVGSPSGQP